MPADLVSEIVATGAPRTAQQRDLWMDLFSNFCESIMGQTLEEHTGGKEYPEMQLKTDITLAAELADHALSEVAYRFVKHAPQMKRRAKR